MNKSALKKNIGKKVRIRPVPLKRTLSGFKRIDDLWFVERVSDDSIELSNLTTGHSKKIGLDHVKEYKTDPKFESDGFIILRSQFIIDNKTINVEPILNQRD